MKSYYLYIIDIQLELDQYSTFWEDSICYIFPKGSMLNYIQQYYWFSDGQQKLKRISSYHPQSKVLFHQYNGFWEESVATFPHQVQTMCIICILLGWCFGEVVSREKIFK